MASSLLNATRDWPPDGDSDDQAVVTEATKRVWSTAIPDITSRAV